MLDVIKIRVKAGDGGDGRVSFLHLKSKPKAGPDGGDGGDGGSVFLVADLNYPDLSHLAKKHLYKAGSGQVGGKRKKTGRKGEDIFIPVPVGTWVWQVPANFKLSGNVSNQLKQRARLIKVMNSPNIKHLIAQGGLGGRGNWHFRSPVNQAPKGAEAGTPGEDKVIVLELKLIADVGLIGLPNAGKSSLLTALTKAKPKVASYPFTTLHPSLGVLYPKEWGINHPPIVIADIPGLIKGAAQGKGLGHQFLRHIQRNRVLLHLIEPVFAKNSQLDLSAMRANYQTIRQELEIYGWGLSSKPELKLISKADLVKNDQELSQAVQTFKANPVSIHNKKLLKQLIKRLVLQLNKG